MTETYFDLGKGIVVNDEPLTTDVIVRIDLSPYKSVDFSSYLQRRLAQGR